MIESVDLPQVLKKRGLQMGRQKHQRPNVKLWKGKSGEKFWKAEWRQYLEGQSKPKHRAQTWPCSEFTKADAPVHFPGAAFLVAALFGLAALATLRRLPRVTA